MRVLALQPYADAAGHYGKYATLISQDITRLGHDVTLLVNYIELEKYLKEEPQFRLVSLGAQYKAFKYDEMRHISELYRLVFGRMRNNLALLSAGLRLARQEPFDAVQLLSYELVSTWLFLMFRHPAFFRPISIQIAAPNFSPDKYYGGRFQRFWRQLQKHALVSMIKHRRIHALNVYSDVHAKALREQLQIPDDFPVHVTGDSRAKQGIRFDKPEARRAVGLDGYEGTVFLMFGTLRRDKGLDTLLDTLQHAAEKTGKDDFRFIICGMLADWTPGDHPILSDPRVITHFKYLEETEIPTYFCAADALVLPYASFYIGSSGPLYDACEYGLPVIATDVSEMGRVVKAEQFGILVQPDNAKALAEALLQFLALPNTEREKLGERAQQVIGQQHTNDDVAKQFVASWELAQQVISPNGVHG